MRATTTLSESVWVGPRPRVLYVESAPESAHYLADALRAQHIDVTVATAERAAHGPRPARRPGCRHPERHRGAKHRCARPRARWKSFVRDQGRGLIFAAGERTYGKQGYAGSRGGAPAAGALQGQAQAP